MTLLWIILTIVAIVIVLKLAGKWRRKCGPGCPPPKPTLPKRSKTYSEQMKEIRKKIENLKRPKPNGSAGEEKNGKDKRI